MSAAAIPAPTAGRRPGLGRRLTEFMVVGGLTLFLYPLSWLLRGAIGLDAAELAVGFTMFHLAHVINDPHFAVTYVLFYKDVRARMFGGAFTGLQWLRYVLAGVVVPIALAAWALGAILTESSWGLGLMVQLMFLLVGWHYVKQGFGVAVVLSARRGIRWAPVERRLILAHCYTGWFYAWSTPHDPGGFFVEKGVVYQSIGQPTWLEPITFALVFATGASLVVVLIRKRLREGRLPLLTPMVALLCSVWAWLVFSGIDPLVRYVVPALHGLQYLYFVQLMKGNQAKEREGEPWFEPSAKTRLAVLAVTSIGLGFVLFDVLPDALDAGLAPARGYADENLGVTPWLAAVSTFVNLHHYFMDSVIWRRDNPETRYLVAGAS